MSLSDSLTQQGKRSRETSEVFNSVFGFLMDFADQAETIVPQPKRRAIADDDATDKIHEADEEPEEDGGDGNAGELSVKLPAGDKEELLKDVFGEIVGNMLDKLPEDGKEAVLVRCFDGLFPKLPCESQNMIEIKLKDASSKSQEAFAIVSTPESPLALPNLFPTDALVQAGHKKERVRVKYPDAIKKPLPPPNPRPPSLPPPPHHPARTGYKKRCRSEEE